MLVAGVELGGTKCVCLLAGGPDDVRDEVRLETRDPESTLAEIRRTLEAWHVNSVLHAIGIASFGPLDLDPLSPHHGCIVSTPKAGWSGVDVCAGLRHLHLPMTLDTDVNGAALAEGRWGGARGLDDYVYVTVGTGIGVGTVVHGRPIRGSGHSEAGHLRIGRLFGDEWPGACPFHGDCVEGLASGAAIVARCGRPAESLSPDDPVWEPVALALGSMLHNLVLTVAPQRILVGGGIAEGQPFLLPRVRRALVRSLGGYAHATHLARDVEHYVVAPELGRNSGPLGAVALAFDAAAADAAQRAY